MPQTSRANLVKRHSTFNKGAFYSKCWFANHRSAGTLLPQGLCGIIPQLQVPAQELYVCSKEPSIFRQRALYSLQKEPSTSSKDQASWPCPSFYQQIFLFLYLCFQQYLGVLELYLEDATPFSLPRILFFQQEIIYTVLWTTNSTMMNVRRNISYCRSLYICLVNIPFERF